ncbi:hygromycin-B 7''-O-kinase [Microdochium nivale]|nr:hygromycin-B 7''-O-kinase [Microdochium nivale]
MSTAAASNVSHPDSDDSNSDDNSDDSATSTVVYDHEPFDTFKRRALSLAQSYVWTDVPAEQILVTRMPGGGFNRIIGLTRQNPPDDDIEYILRVPRFDSARIDRDVAALLFLKQHTHIPAPRVIAFDQTESNPVLSPYMVQNRLPGSDLIHAFPELDYQGKYLFAKAFGLIMRQMLETRSCEPGNLALLHDDTKTTTANPSVCVEAWGSISPNDIKPYRAVLGPEETSKSLLDILSAMFATHKNVALAREAKDRLTTNLMDQFTRMSQRLNQQGYLNQTTYSLAHLDLAPRNILVRTEPHATEETIISGILDWDSAVFAPGFMACAPPMWIWAWQDDEDEDERMANDDPPDTENMRLKGVFEECAGQEYCRYAYDAKYRLARRLVRFAMEGLRSSEDCKDADRMLEEWDGIQRKEQEGNKG